MRTNRRNFIRGTLLTAGGYALSPRGIPAVSTSSAASTSRVSIAKGDDRRSLTQKVLDPLRSDIELGVAGKQIYIKANVVDYDSALAVTHIETLRGLLDFLSPLTKEKIIIGESTASTKTTTECFEKHGYPALEKEYNVQLLDLAFGPCSQVGWVKDNQNKVLYPRITSLVLDPTKYHISLARMKTHSGTVCTLAMKNYYMGSALNFPPGHPLYSQSAVYINNRDTHPRTLMHMGGGPKGLCQSLVMMSTHFVPDLSIIDEFEGMEGDGPTRGTPVDHRVMVAGKDVVSVDRVGLELMGLDYSMVKVVEWASDLKVGQGDLNRIEIIGPSIDSLRIPYKKSPNYSNSIAFIDIAPIPNWTSVEDTRPKEFSLANYPNPFNSATTVEFDLPSDGQAALEIFNTAGQRVRRLVSSHLRAGKYALSWDARDDRGRTVSTGAYFLRLDALSQSSVHKIMFLR